MSGISSVTAYVSQTSYTTETFSASKTKDKDGKVSQSLTYEKTSASKETAAAVFESSSSGAGQIENARYDKPVGRLVGKPADHKKIQQLLTEAEEKKEAFRQMIEKLFTKQSDKAVTSGTMADFYRSLDVPDSVREQARKDTAEDGYWGVEQTSDRILSFAQALAGDNRELAEKLLDAVKEGFRLAGEDWGEELPDLSQRTMSITLEKMNSWINGLGGGAGEASANAAGFYASESASFYSESVTITD